MTGLTGSGRVGGGEVTAYPCSVCGDPVPQCETLIREDSCEGCWLGEHDSGICNCCYGVICSKHTANPSCPHQPSDHDEALAAVSAADGGQES